MEKFLKMFPKFYPILPAEKDTTKLILAIALYLIAPIPVAAIVGFILGLTIILAPVGILVGIALNVYGIVGVVFSILTYLGKDLDEILTSSKKEESEVDVSVEAPAEEATEDAVEETAAE